MGPEDPAIEVVEADLRVMAAFQPPILFREYHSRMCHTMRTLHPFTTASVKAAESRRHRALLLVKSPCHEPQPKRNLQTRHTPARTDSDDTVGCQRGSINPRTLAGHVRSLGTPSFGIVGRRAHCRSARRYETFAIAQPRACAIVQFMHDLRQSLSNPCISSTCLAPHRCCTVKARLPLFQLILDRLTLPPPSSPPFPPFLTSQHGPPPTLSPSEIRLTLRLPVVGSGVERGRPFGRSALVGRCGRDDLKSLHRGRGGIDGGRPADQFTLQMKCLGSLFGVRGQSQAVPRVSTVVHRYNARRKTHLISCRPAVKRRLERTSIQCTVPSHGGSSNYSLVAWGDPG